MFAPLIAAVIVGFGFAEGWDDLIRFLWAQPFGETESLYGHDIAFYLFKLPFLERIQNTIVILAFMATAPLLIVYSRAGLVAYVRVLGSSLRERCSTTFSPMPRCSCSPGRRATSSTATSC